jgi:TonB-linked SusC/RagA family outer membrane protein
MNLGFAASTNSQSLDKIKVSLSLEDAPLSTVFKELEAKTKFVFAYSAKLESDKSFDLHYQDASLRQVLEDLAQQASIEFKRINKTISVTAIEMRKVETKQAMIQVTGSVTDEDGGPLPGVNVIEKGTANGTSTDSNGDFSIQVADDNSVLVFSFIGYRSQEIKVGSQTIIPVKLALDVTTMQEIVVIGYGEQEKKDLTGAVSVVDNKSLSKVQATTVAEAMQGLAAGVSVRNSGRAGSESTIEIRGLGNFSNNQPLYVIDGVPTIATRDFNASDVESIQILKDASAAAIYGSRAANGVIIITTKKGKAGPLKVDFSGRYGVQVLPEYDFMEAADFKKYNTMAYREAIEVEKFPWVIDQGYQQFPEGIDTDWQSETFRTAQTHDYNLTFSGGNEFGTYLVSGNYFGNTGTSFGSSFDRYSFRVNTEGKRGAFKIGENFSISSGFSEDLITNPYWDMLRMLPTIPVHDVSHPGGFGYGDEGAARTFGVNPIARESLEETTNENLRLRGNVYGEVGFLKNALKYRINVGLEASNERYKYIRKVGNWTLNQPFDPSSVNENRGQYVSALVENTIHFDKEIGKHHIDAFVGTTFQRQKYEQIWGTKRNLIEIGGKYYDVLDAGTTDPESGGFTNEDALISYLGRFNYSYDEKYYLTGTIRRDGSSRFAKNNRWGNFPSISAAWRISKENFFDVPFIDDLKIRANFGTLGNSNIGRSIGYSGSFYGSAIYNLGNWDYQALLNSTIIATLGRDQHLVNGATQVKLANADLRWETKEVVNIGTDMSFLNNRLAFTMEYFVATTKDVLTEMPILLSTGNDGGLPFVNAASIRNKGFEITTTWKDQLAGGLRYSFTANISTVRNEVLELGYGNEEVLNSITKTEIGEPIGMFYLRKTNGIFRSNEEVLAHVNSQGKVIQPNAKPGDIRYVDFDDNGEINDADRQITGNPWPRFDLGLVINLEYKNFDLSTLWYGSFGQKVYNGARSTVERFDDNSNYFAFEKGSEPYQENPNSDFPRILYGDDRNSRGDTDRWLENGSYFRLRNVTLGYNLPKTLSQRIRLTDARIYVTAQNLLTFTKYKGLDPDFTAPEFWRRGHDEIRYPNAKTFLVGVQFSF